MATRAATATRDRPARMVRSAATKRVREMDDKCGVPLFAVAAGSETDRLVLDPRVDSRGGQRGHGCVVREPVPAIAMWAL